MSPTVRALPTFPRILALAGAFGAGLLAAAGCSNGGTGGVPLGSIQQGAGNGNVVGTGPGAANGSQAPTGNANGDAGNSGAGNTTAGLPAGNGNAAPSNGGGAANGNAANNGNLVATGNAPVGTPNAPLPNGTDVAITPIAATINPNINFDGVPRTDTKAIALTFDDGPDGAQGATTMVLDTLKKENLKATFFLCANIGFADLETDPVAQAQLKRIVAEGHPIANHTYDHKNLAGLTAAQVDQEFQQLEDVVNKVLGPTAPKMTMVRTPFGSPFQLDNPNTQRLASTITRHGIQIGWGMDPKDWTFDHYKTSGADFDADVQKVIAAVQTLIDNKQWGIVLLHAVHLPSATALPTVIKMFRDNGYHFVSLEEVVRSQFGANSASVMAANRAAGTAK